MSEFVYIWRLEDKDGNGIFRGNVPDTDMRYATAVDRNLGYSNYRHPSPAEDYKLESARPFAGKKFGFKTLKDFKFWFYKRAWRVKMRELGIFLRKYQVPKSSVWIGDTQLVFIPHDAELVETRSPDYCDWIHFILKRAIR